MSYNRRFSEYLGEMHTTEAEQYGTPAIFVGPERDADKIIAFARLRGAIYHEDGPDDECFVLVLRPDIGPELYTEAALRGSLKGGAS